MIIVGLHNDEDASVSLLKDGKVVEAVGEERLNREKLYQGLPRKSLELVLSRANHTIEDVDVFAYGWHGRQNDYGEYARRLASRVWKATQNDPSCVSIIDERITSEFQRDAATRLEFEEWMHDLGVPASKIHYLDHHSSHAWSAFAASGFEEAFVFTFDGRGDLKSASASYAAKNAGVREHDYALSFDSLGFLYGQITGFLGFKPHRHEGKVTGLAAYGDPAKTKPLFEKMICWDGEAITANLGFYKPFFTNLSDDLAKALGEHSKEDLAAGVQAHCEDLVCHYVRHWMNRISESSGNVCLAGGLFANVRINQRVRELDGVEDVFVFPHMGDGGLAVGAAYGILHQLSGQVGQAIKDVYLGPAFDDAEIEASLKRYESDLQWSKPASSVDATVDDLCANRVVGRFSGRMEFGPRALGGRSILFHTRDQTVNEWLNARMKRTEFMPFAPVTPAEFASECYVGWRPQDRAAEFMTITYDCTDTFSEQHPAVVHIDKTARPQVVREDIHGDYHRVVSRYCEKTGERALINTSFNKHEEPIVCSPEDAIQGLIAGMIDVLHIEGYRVLRRD